MRKVFYVYEHIRLDSEEVFYVGKGCKYRDRCPDGRNDWWNYVAEKAGWTWRRVYDGLSNPCAFTLEKLHIAKLRSLGAPLVNLTDGGEGSPGFKSPKAKPVYCSNGLSFSNGSEAAEWLSVNGYPCARQGHIAASARGERARAYGFAWSYDGTPVDDGATFLESIREANGKRVFCSDGSKYYTCKDASDATGIRQGDIARAARGEHTQAGGLAWWYEGDEPKTSDSVFTRSKPYLCGNGMVFQSVGSAVYWLRANVNDKAQSTPLTKAANGVHSKAYGFTWSYA